MDFESSQTLARLIRTQRVAALGTLRDGAPLVSMILFAVGPDYAQFLIHASRLAQHTQDILQDARVSLMIAGTDTGQGDAQQLARVSIRGEAHPISTESAEFTDARTIYLAKFPHAAMNFQLSDFSLYRIVPFAARFVAGFGRIFNLTLPDFNALKDL